MSTTPSRSSGTVHTADVDVADVTGQGLPPTATRRSEAAEAPNPAPRKVSVLAAGLKTAEFTWGVLLGSSCRVQAPACPQAAGTGTPLIEASTRTEVSGREERSARNHPGKTGRPTRQVRVSLEAERTAQSAVTRPVWLPWGPPVTVPLIRKTSSPRLPSGPTKPAPETVSTAPPSSEMAAGATEAMCREVSSAAAALVRARPKPTTRSAGASAGSDACWDGVRGTATPEEAARSAFAEARGSWQVITPLLSTRRR
mmetsp:Transcript_16636/g.63026  ORF Transcript_16636/g.63026 Transcript_16636/m.63026 type:complete len:256 (+) Transcript_16636:2751-3518(+)